MIPLAHLAMAVCLAVSGASDHVVAGDLAAASPTLARLPADTIIAWAPAPGVQRIFHAAELHRISAGFGMTAVSEAPVPERDLCVERPVAPLDPVLLREALEKQLPEARIEIVDFSRQPAPAGTLEFPLSGLRRSADAAYWNGTVRYAGSRRFSVWAKVRVRVTARVVVAVEDLKPGRPIEAGQLRLETREDFPQAGRVESLQDAAGKLPRVLIRSGAAIAAQALEAAPDVARGDTVTVAVWSGAAHLELEARAESAGVAGQRVAIRNPISNQRFFARVEAKGRVSVGQAPPRPVSSDPVMRDLVLRQEEKP